MLVDSRLEFSAGQTLTGNGASTNSVDVGAKDQIGRGRPLFLVVQLTDIAKGSAANETYVMDLQTDDNDSFGSPAAIASLTIPRLTPAGTRYVIGFPYQNERFLRLNFTLGGTSPNLKYKAWLTDQEPESWRSYPGVIG